MRNWISCFKSSSWEGSLKGKTEPHWLGGHFSHEGWYLKSPPKCVETHRTLLMVSRKILTAISWGFGRSESCQFKNMEKTLQHYWGMKISLKGANFPQSLDPAVFECLLMLKGHKVPEGDHAVLKFDHLVIVSDAVPADIGVSFWLVPYKIFTKVTPGIPVSPMWRWKGRPHNTHNPWI